MLRTNILIIVKSSASRGSGREGAGCQKEGRGAESQGGGGAQLGCGGGDDYGGGDDHGGGDGYESCGDLLRGEDGDQSGGDGGDNPYNNAGDHRHKGNRGKRKQWIGKQKKLSSTGCPHNFV